MPDRRSGDGVQHVGRGCQLRAIERVAIRDRDPFAYLRHDVTDRPGCFHRCCVLFPLDNRQVYGTPELRNLAKTCSALYPLRRMVLRSTGAFQTADLPKVA